jgi:hypothetical protein
MKLKTLQKTIIAFNISVVLLLLMALHKLDVSKDQRADVHTSKAVIDSEIVINKRLNDTLKSLSLQAMRAIYRHAYFAGAIRAVNLSNSGFKGDAIHIISLQLTADSTRFFNSPQFK